MYKKLGYSEQACCSKKLEAYLKILELDSKKKANGRLRRSIINNSYIYNDFISNKSLESRFSEIALVRDYDFKGFSTNLNEYIASVYNTLKTIARLKYLRTIIPEKNYKYIKNSRLEDHVYLYNLIDMYADISKEDIPSYMAPSFRGHYEYISNIFTLVKNKDLVKRVNKIITTTRNESLENTYDTINKIDNTSYETNVYSDIIELNELIEYIVVSKELNEYIFYAGYDADEYSKLLLIFLNKYVLAKAIPKEVFVKLNPKVFEEYTLHDITTMDNLDTGTDDNFIINSILQAFGLEERVDTYRLSTEEFADFLVYDNEEDLLGMIDEAGGTPYKNTIKLPFSCLDTATQEELSDKILKMITKECYDFEIYATYCSMENDTLEILHTDGCYANLDFIETFAEILTILYKQHAISTAA